jgi:hypothetical protein
MDVKRRFLSCSLTLDGSAEWNFKKKGPPSSTTNNSSTVNRNRKTIGFRQLLSE